MGKKRGGVRVQHGHPPTTTCIEWAWGFSRKPPSNRTLAIISTPKAPICRLKRSMNLRSPGASPPSAGGADVCQCQCNQGEKVSTSPRVPTHWQAARESGPPVIDGGEIKKRRVAPMSSPPHAGCGTQSHPLMHKATSHPYVTIFLKISGLWLGTVGTVPSRYGTTDLHQQPSSAKVEVLCFVCQ
jgi:hypothetical protein